MKKNLLFVISCIFFVGCSYVPKSVKNIVSDDNKIITHYIKPHNKNSCDCNNQCNSCNNQCNSCNNQCNSCDSNNQYNSCRYCD